MRRICIIGLDGVGPLNLKTILSRITLPNLSKAVRKGAFCTAISIPPYTPIAWTSIFTGVNPGKHGVFGQYHVERTKDEFKLTLNSSLNVMYPRIFEIASIYGLKCLVVNVPLTYPPETLMIKDNSIIIYSWDSPKQYIYPRNYYSAYREYLVDYPLPPRILRKHEVKDYILKVEKYIVKRAKLYIELLDKDVDLATIVFSVIDWLFHKIPHLVEGLALNMIQKVLKIIDQIIGYAMQNFDLVTIVSDHGFKVSRITININSILYRARLVRVKYFVNLAKYGVWFRRIVKARTRNVRVSFPLGEEHKGRLGVKRLDLRRLIRRLLPVSYRFDYEKSYAFMLEKDIWGIYTLDDNVRRIVQRLFKLIPGISVLEPQEVFKGPYLKYSPNVILVPTSKIYFKVGGFEDPLYTITYSGEHEIHSLALFYGDDVSKASLSISLFDIAPTILAYQCKIIPHDADGRVIDEIFSIDVRRGVRVVNVSAKYRLRRKLRSFRSPVYSQ